MIVQRVEPAGASRETLYLLGLCLLILALAAAVVLAQQTSTTEKQLASYQLDARRDLSAAEQGIYTDLLVALEEIHYLKNETGALATPAELAEESYPPFATDISSVQRGGHSWKLAQLNDGAVYLGVSQQTAIAGHFLLLTDANSPLNDTVWLNASPAAELPVNLQQSTLVAAGWKQLVREFDRGVTRHTTH